MEGELLPTELVRRLAEHPQVSVTVGQGERVGGGRALCAASETRVFLLIPSRSPLEPRLMQDTRVEVRGGPEDGSWTLLLRGQAAIGLNLASHPLRADLEVWLPLDSHPRGWVVAQFWPVWVECTLPSGAGAQRFLGPTPAAKGQPGPGTIWLHAAFDGLWLLLALGLLAPWLMLGVWGVDLPLRPLALVLVTLGVVGLMASGNLWTRAALRRAERQGRAEGPHTELLRRGRVAPGALEQAALASLAIGVVGTLGTALWGAPLLVVTLLCSGVWALWPLFALRILNPEDDAAAEAERGR